MRYTIKSRNEGLFQFWAPDNGGYIRLEAPDHPGTLGQQICAGGHYMGSTLSIRGEYNYDQLKQICQKWYRQYRRKMR